MKNKLILLFSIVLLSPYTIMAEKIHIQKTIQLGNIEQHILITGADKDAPILLYLHGHGMPSMLFAHYTYNDPQSILHKNFIQVHWDQRGAGLSYRNRITKSQMNFDSYLQDAHELTQYLKSKFNKEKIYLLCESWGSMLGLKLIQQYPEDYHAYFGEGQSLNLIEAYQNAYDFAVNEANIQQNKKAIRQLSKTKVPTVQSSIKEIMNFSKTGMKWADIFIREKYPSMDLMKAFKESMKKAPEYKGLKNKLALLKGMQFTQKSTLEELIKVDLRNESKTYKVPIFLMMGKYDFLTPQVEAYFPKIEAPDKVLVIFENSGHVPSAEESELFEKTLLKLAFKNN